MRVREREGYLASKVSLPALMSGARITKGIKARSVICDTDNRVTVRMHVIIRSMRSITQLELRVSQGYGHGRVA